MDVYKKLLSYVPKERYLAYLVIFFSCVSVFFIVGAYYALYQFLIELVVEANHTQSTIYAITIATLLAVGAILYIVGVAISHVLGFRLETNLRKKGIDGLSEASFRFYDKYPSGKVRKIIDDNAAQTHMIVAHLIPDNANAILTPILALILGFVVSWHVGLILVLLLIFSGFSLKFMMGEKTFMQVYQNALENLSSETVEYVRGIQVIKIFGADVISLKAMHKAITDYAEHAHKYSQSCKRPYVIYQWLFLGLIAFLVPLMVLFIDLGNQPEVLAVELIMLLFLTGVLFTAIMKIMYLSMYAFQGKMAVDKLEALYDEMHKDHLVFGQEEKFDNFDIVFDHVTFGYEETPVLQDLSFTLKEKKTYALIGSSGSGKSTIAKLISGFYKIDGGSIKIGGKPLEAYNEQALIKNIAFVFQNVKLFKMSIFENVKLAKEDATREEVLEALHVAGCDSILDKFETREETIIGSKGVYLSVGEKQRLAIARAILKDANIVVLDEASASVDPDNEHELQLAFASLMKDRTVIMIAHRLSSIRYVDEILVIEDGKIIERGKDEELMQKDSKYRYFQTLYGQANEWRVGYDSLN